MFVKKAAGKVYGAKLTAAEKRAMDIEIQKELAEFDRKHMLEIDAIVLWGLHTELGFGVDRLKRFYDNFAGAMDDLINRYEMEQGDKVWLCTYKLKELGIDIDKWDRERNGNNGSKTE